MFKGLLLNVQNLGWSKHHDINQGTFV